jgi:hypothetical protein
MSQPIHPDDPDDEEPRGSLQPLVALGLPRLCGQRLPLNERGLLPLVSAYRIAQHQHRGNIVPMPALEWNIPSRMEALPKQGDQAVESKKTWSGPLDHEVRPLSLCLHTQICPAPFTGDFSTLAFHKIGDDGKARLGLISRERRPWLMFPLRKRASTFDRAIIPVESDQAVSIRG